MGQLDIDHEEVHDDETLIIAAQMYELHGYKLALKKVETYMNECDDERHLSEWQRIAAELAVLRKSEQNSKIPRLS